MHNCLICGLDDSRFQVSLKSTTATSNRLLSEFIEETLNVEITPKLHEDGNICKSCFDRFNDLDEHMIHVESIKASLIQIFELNNQEEHLIEDESEEQIEEVVCKSDPSDQVIEDSMVSETIIFEAENSESYQKNTDSAEFSSEWYDDSKPFQCDICLKRFKENSKLKAHTLTHTDERNVVCPVCNKRFKTAACLRSHRRIHSDLRVQCEMCPKRFISKSELDRHFNATHGTRELNCEFCGHISGSRTELLAHQRIHLDRNTNRKKCPECPATFTTNGKLNRHMKSHSKQYEHSCGICGKQFLYSYNVHAHMKQVHDGQKRSAPSIPCDVCHKKFRNHQSLKTHLRSEHGEYFEESDMIIAEELVDGIVEVDES